MVTEERHQQKDKDEFKFFIKENYDFSMYCNSRYNSPTQNMLIRLQNTFVSTINQSLTQCLPKYMLLVLDDDIINFMAFTKTGMTQLISNWVTWLVQQFKLAVAKRKEKLPKKSKSSVEPCIYWCLPPTHISFGEAANECRKKFGFCVESIVKDIPNMRVIKMKEGWNYSDKSLVSSSGKLTEAGKYAYWEAVDLAFKFNAERHEVFLAKMKVNSAKQPDAGKSLVKTEFQSQGRQRSSQEDQQSRFEDRNDMQNFFIRHRNIDDRYHWENKRCHFDTGNRFMLPRVHRR